MGNLLGCEICRNQYELLIAMNDGCERCFINMNIDSTNVTDITRAIINNHNLQDLEIRSLFTNKDVLDEFIQCLAHLERLVISTQLRVGWLSRIFDSMPYNNLRELWLNNMVVNRIDYRSMINVINNSNIEILWLCRFYVPNSSNFMMLIDAIHNCKKIVLDRIGIDEQSLLYLCDRLKTNVKLEELDINENTLIIHNVINELGEMLKINRTLRKIDLGWCNGITNDETKYLYKCIKRNKVLRKLNFMSAEYNNKYRKKIDKRLKRNNKH